MDFSQEDRAELLESAEMSLNRLNRLVENLLDLSRLQAGALTLELRATTLEEVLPAALESLDLPSAEAPAVDVQNLETVPALQADPLCSNGCWRTWSATRSATPPHTVRCW